jgi:hypothetical protein
VHTTGRGEIANEVIQGDLVESRVVLAHGAMPLGDRLSIDGPVGGSEQSG